MFWSIFNISYVNFTKQFLLKARGFLCLIALIFISTNSAQAQQCEIKVLSSTEGCVPFNFQATAVNNSGKTVASYTWDFGDASGATTKDVTHYYNSRGKYTVQLIITYTDGSKCSSSVSTDIKVYGRPKAGIIMPGSGSTTQCYQKNGSINRFCFSDNSQRSLDGHSIVRYLWNFGDGDTSNQQSPCHTYDAPGKYSVSLEVFDSKGCSDRQILNSAITVLRDLKTAIKMSGGAGCGQTTYTFNNVTDTNEAHIRNWYWDFGDGSAIDSVNWSPKHTYTKDGHFTVTFRIINQLGCEASYTTTAQNVVAKLQVAYKDTMSWGSAKNGVAFSAKEVPGASYWEWNFDDPKSDYLNRAPFAWNAYHQFAGGPGTYNIKFKVIHPICGVLDTCFSFHIYGPMARITLPEEQYRNNYVPARPMPQSEFTKINNSDGCSTPTSLNYAVFTNKITKNYKIYTYCNANAVTGSAEYDTVEICGGTEYRLRKIKYQPTDSFIITRTDSTEVQKVFTKGGTIPTGAYFPSSGKLNVLRMEPDGYLRHDKPINMHDSDLYFCSANNYVQFTNHSIKYRLNRATDDKYPYLNPDTCKHKNYPYASDSMQYFWKFNDGLPCTSTVSNQNPNCMYSTEVAPYHLFSSTNASGCHAVELEVTDTWTDKNGKQRTSTDKTTLMLKTGAPDAGWDRNAFKNMTWEMQQFHTNPGVPGDPTRPLRGFKMDWYKNCSGYGEFFKLNFTETLPNCGNEDYWLVLDSAAATKVVCTSGGKTKLDHGFLGANNKIGYPVGGPKSQWMSLPWLGRYWYNLGDTGYKTIGVVIKNGNCYDTAWYHNYIRLNSAFPEFCIYNSANNSPLGCSSGFTKNLCPDSLGHKPKFIDIVPKYRQVKDYQGGIYYRIRRIETPSGDDYYTKPFWPAGASLEPTEINYIDSISAENYAKGKDTLKAKLPFPGAYEIYSESGNKGCFGSDHMYIFNGHYAKFWANDSVVCVGDTVRFDQKTRYWTRNCPAPPGAGPPPTCLWEELNPWSNDPVANRKTLGWDPTKNTAFIREQKPEWHYGDGTTSNSSLPGNADKSKPYHIYTKPGVYTVTMVTQDSTNCKIATVRKNFIKVLEVKPGFMVSNQKDTQSYCGTLPILKDTSKLILSPYSKGKYARYVELRKKRDPFTGVERLELDTITVDSLILSQWQIGSKTFTTAYGQSVFPPFTEAGTFDVKLTSKSAHCEGEIEKKNVVTFPEIKEVFQPADSVGCAPFAVTIKLNKSYSAAYSYLWHKGDGTTQTSQPGDTSITLTYNTPGKYALSVIVTDTILQNQSYDTCRVTYPDTISNPLLPRHHITVLNKPGKPQINLVGKDSLYSTMKGDAYTWLKDGVVLADNTVGIRVSQKGDYKLIVKLSNCISDTSDVYRYDPNSIAYTGQLENGISVYPNPSTGMLIMENKYAEINAYELVSVTGQKMLVHNQKLPAGKHTLQLSALAKGIYFLNITTKTGVLHLRVVLQ